MVRLLEYQIFCRYLKIDVRIFKTACQDFDFWKIRGNPELILSMYVNTKSKFNYGDIETDWMKLEKGDRQGCVLSPLLFSIYTDELSARVRDSGLRLSHILR